MHCLLLASLLEDLMNDWRRKKPFIDAPSPAVFQKIQGLSLPAGKIPGFVFGDLKTSVDKIKMKR